MVTCSAGRRGQTVGEDPILAFGILGPGTERTDRGDKAREHRSAPSVRRCIMLRQDSVAAGVHARDGGDDRSLSILVFEADTLALPRSAPDSRRPGSATAPTCRRSTCATTRGAPSSRREPRRGYRIATGLMIACTAPL